MAAGLLAVVGLWLARDATRSERPDRAEPRRDFSKAAEQHAATASLRSRAEPRASTLRSHAEPRASILRSSAEPRASTAQGNERPADGHPHPITLEHRRLYRDVDLLQAADAAIQAGQYQAARALLAQHHSEVPGLSQVEEEGLLLLTDCGEQRSPSNILRVQQFYDLHTDSTVRRRLRRACLEQPR